MVERQRLSDLVVVVPGCAGSVLAVGSPNKEVWARSGRAIMKGVASLGRNIGRLKLPAGFGDSLPEGKGEGEPSDGVLATRLMPDLHVIPGLWAPLKGYSELARFFRDRFTVAEPGPGQSGNLLEFAYDWRLSNAVSGRRLATAVLPALEAWRKQGHPDAKLVFICHSMGGLVARWFLEVLEGWQLTRWLITLGTPYQGSVAALEALVNGLPKKLGLLGDNLTELVRSFPSVYELLPTYACFDSGDGSLRHLTEVSGLGLEHRMVESAQQFHRRIAGAAEQRKDYGIVAIKGVFQPTSQSARMGGEGIEALRTYGGIDRGGDGTVPRPSAHPPEWEGESGGLVVGAPQRHTTLQATEGVHTQLFLRLTGQLGTWMGGEPISVEVPSLLAVGEPLVVEVGSENDTLGLAATVTLHDTAVRVAGPRGLANLGEGRYRTSFEDLAPGTYQVTVAAAEPTTAVEPVSDLTIVWEGEG